MFRVASVRIPDSGQYGKQSPQPVHSVSRTSCILGWIAHLGQTSPRRIQHGIHEVRQAFFSLCLSRSSATACRDFQRKNSSARGEKTLVSLLGNRRELGRDQRPALATVFAVVDFPAGRGSEERKSIGPCFEAQRAEFML